MPAENIEARYSRLSRRSLESEAVEHWEALADIAEALHEHRAGKLDSTAFVWRVREVVAENLGMRHVPR